MPLTRLDRKEIDALMNLVLAAEEVAKLIQNNERIKFWTRVREKFDKILEDLNYG